MQSVIYLFVSPSGRAYAGRHACDHATFPRRGMGPLPDGYTGSGKLWGNVARKHGPDLRWVILRRFPEGTRRATLDAAERRAIRLVRRLWADRCMNVREGGTGLTVEDARALAVNPDWLAKNRAIGKALAQTPERRDQLVRARAASSAQAKTPEGIAQRKLASAASKSPGSIEKNRSAQKARYATSEGKAHLDRAREKNNRKRRARKALAPFIQPPAWTQRGATLWAYRPPLRLRLSVLK